MSVWEAFRFRRQVAGLLYCSRLGSRRLSSAAVETLPNSLADQGKIRAWTRLRSTRIRMRGGASTRITAASACIQSTTRCGGIELENTTGFRQTGEASLGLSPRARLAFTYRERVGTNVKASPLRCPAH